MKFNSTVITSWHF